MSSSANLNIDKPTPRDPPSGASVADHSTDQGSPFYCLDCGYDLRGHGLDSCRCPECGRPNSLAEFQVKEDELRRTYVKLDTWSTWSIAGLALVSLAAGLILWWNWIQFGTFVLAVGALLLALSAWRMRATCKAKPGWAGAYLKLLLVMEPYVLAFLLLAILVVSDYFSSQRSLSLLFLVLFADYVLRWCGVNVSAPYWRAKSALMDLQLDTALQVARRKRRRQRR